MHPDNKEKKGIFDNPKNLDRLLTGLFIFLGVLLIAEFFIHLHPHYDYEKFPGFYAVYGFLSYVFLVLVARFIIRPILMRREDYYD